MGADLVIGALTAAEHTRGSLKGAIRQTHRCARYTIRAFADACRGAGVFQRLSARQREQGRPMGCVDRFPAVGPTFCQSAEWGPTSCTSAATGVFLRRAL